MECPGSFTKRGHSLVSLNLGSNWLRQNKVHMRRVNGHSAEENTGALFSTGGMGLSGIVTMIIRRDAIFR